MAEVDRITFAQPPAVYVQAIFDETNAKTRRGLTAQEFDAEVIKLGNRLYEDLFHNAQGDLPGFKSFYRDELYPASEHEAQGRSRGADRAARLGRFYIPWEILRASLSDASGRWHTDRLAFASASTWRVGWPGRGRATNCRSWKSPWWRRPRTSGSSSRRWTPCGICSGAGQDDRAQSGLETFLQDGRADVLHFACHGAFDDVIPARSAVKLEDRVLRPVDLTPAYRNFARPASGLHERL
ncbi:MAG: hypothetical protein HZY76_23630 [Anaerolineae bacterium]|nr:MAG: hypothetical protein HZY76_23630 [Anaerolineae bacterium]